MFQSLACDGFFRYTSVVLQHLISLWPVWWANYLSHLQAEVGGVRKRRLQNNQNHPANFVDEFKRFASSSFHCYEIQSFFPGAFNYRSQTKLGWGGGRGSAFPPYYPLGPYTPPHFPNHKSRWYASHCKAFLFSDTITPLYINNFHVQALFISHPKIQIFNNGKTYNNRTQIYKKHYK